MVRMGWSYSDLLECPADVLAAIIEVLNKGAQRGY